VKFILHVLFLSLLVWGCRAHLTYINDYPMSTATFVTRDGLIRGAVPEGWFISHEDTLVPTLTAWLVKNDFSASISLRELSVDPATARQIKNDGLDFLAKLSMKFHEAPAGRNVSSTQPNNFEMKGIKFCEYESGGPESRSRVIVFSASGRYFECEAQAAKSGWSEKDLNQLFRIQQSVIASLSL
jgi:hypothetical protein